MTDRAESQGPDLTIGVWHPPESNPSELSESQFTNVAA